MISLDIYRDGEQLPLFGEGHMLLEQALTNEYDGDWVIEYEPVSEEELVFWDIVIAQAYSSHPEIFMISSDTTHMIAFN